MGTVSTTTLSSMSGGYTSLTGQTATGTLMGMQAAYQIVAATGSYQATFTMSGSTTAGGGNLALKAAAGGTSAADFVAAAGAATVKTSWAQQCSIQYIGSVRCSHDNHFFGWFETIHLNQNLIQGLLTFVVTTANAYAA
jgi:hypothetical protein